MGFGIDSCGTAGNYGGAMAHEGRDETLGHFPAVWRSLSRSHDRYREIRLRYASADVEQERASRHVEERGRIFAVTFGHHPGPNGCRTIESAGGRILEKSGGQQIEAVISDRGIREKPTEFGQRRNTDGVRTGDSRGLEKLEHVRKEAEFAMGSSGRMQSDENFVTHADRTRAG